MNFKDRLKQERLNNKLINRYLNERDDQDFLRYLIDTIYDDTVNVCYNCGKGLMLEELNGDYVYRQCNNCHKSIHYRS